MKYCDFILSKNSANFRPIIAPYYFHVNVTLAGGAMQGYESHRT